MDATIRITTEDAELLTELAESKGISKKEAAGEAIRAGLEREKKVQEVLAAAMQGLEQSG